MNFDSIKRKIFTERPEVKEEYDALAPKYNKIRRRIRSKIESSSSNSTED